MRETRQLKRKLVKDAIWDNVDLVAHRHPGHGRGTSARRNLVSLAVVAITGMLTLPYFAAALSPSLVDRHAQWVFSLPGASDLRGLLASPPGSGVADGKTPEPPFDSPPEVITVSAADTIEELDLRFDQPPPALDREIFELAVKRIILDPGHGGEQVGTSAAELDEKDLTLDISRKLRPILEERGFEVFLTREEDLDLDHKDRVRFANEKRGDLFLSIHINWFGEPDLRGIETFYLGPTVDPELRQQASRENRGTGYTLTEFRELLDDIYLDIRRDESRDFARHIHRSVYGTLRKQVPTLRNRGVKQAPFVVLVGTDMPAVLAEVSCLSHPEETELLRSDAYRVSIAEALADGIENYADSLRPDPPATSFEAASTGT